MKRLRPTSIRQRLLLIAVAVTLLTLGVAGTLLVLNDLRLLGQQMARDLEVLAEVVGDNCVSSLVFDAPQTAQQVLASLRHEPQVRFARLSDAGGRPFARYLRDAAQAPSEPIMPGQGTFSDLSPLGLGTVEVVRELRFDGRPIGVLFIHARTDQLADQLWRYMGIVGLVLLVTLAVSVAFALRLQRKVTEPILELAEKSREISVRGDYSLRLPEPVGRDEVAMLFRGFNAMLARVERHQRALNEIHQQLARRVDDRTRALDAVVREQRLVLGALPLGVIYLIDRRIQRTNPRAAELFGWSEAELVGMSTRPLYPDQAAFEQVGRDGYRAMVGGEFYRVDRELQRKDGSRFWGRLIGQYIDADRPDLGSIWIIDDISRDKALFEELRRAREAAESANRAKDRFVANMSHDLRSPLNALLGFAQLLEADDRLDPGQRERVVGIRRAGDRLLGLIEEVLDLARLGAGGFTEVPVAWDSASLLEEMDGMFRRRAEQKGLVLRVEADRTLPARLCSDHKRLHQVMVNLLDNAIKFTADGTVLLHLAFAADWLTVTVTDTGVGIPVARRDQVYQPFRQLGDQQGPSSEHGLGLGLAIARQIVEHLGGRIELDSEPGRGSRFCVRIPAQVATTPRAGDDGPADRLDTRPDATSANRLAVTGYRRRRGDGPLRILLVDDEPENRLVLRGMLEPLGFALFDAQDGGHCARLAGQVRPDLILMDLWMRPVDGFAAARLLRNQASLQTLPIVALTAAAFEQDRLRAMESGFDAYLTKPVRRATLLQTLADLLPLDWTTTASPTQPTAPPSDPTLSQALDALPAAYRDELRRLVRTGAVTAIGELAQRLAQDDCCPVLAGRIAALAQAFDIAGLRHLIGDA